MQNIHLLLESGPHLMVDVVGSTHLMVDMVPTSW